MADAECRREGDDPHGLRFEMDRLLTYDDDSLIAELQRVAALLPPGPIRQAAFARQARADPTTLVRRFGGWREALERAGLADRYGGVPVTEKMRTQESRYLTADDVVAELRRVAAVVGSDTITRADVRAHSDVIGDRVIDNRFGTWQKALEAAGLTLSPLGRRWTDDDYYENLLDVWTHHGRAPTYAEMSQPPSRITKGAYAAKFGTWGRAKLAFVERVNSDLAAVERAEHEPRTPTPKARPEDSRSIPIGLRYQVLRRDRFRCVTCGRSPATDLGCVLHVDHVVPFSRGGKTTLGNLRSLCGECNVGKGTGDAS